MTELKPCPFCGSTDIDADGVASIKKDRRGLVAFWKDATPDDIENSPSCNNCSASTEIDWNTRAENPNELPLELLPDGWFLDGLNNRVGWEAMISNGSTDIINCGPTPRAAFMAAIKKVK